jgi:hypothetical protein
MAEEIKIPSYIIDHFYRYPCFSEKERYYALSGPMLMKFCDHYLKSYNRLDQRDSLLFFHCTYSLFTPSFLIKS